MNTPHLAQGLLCGAIHAFALSSLALAQWSGDPLLNTPVAVKSGEQVLPKVASTSDGGCYVGWFDQAAGTYQVYLQRFDASGVAMWAPGGMAVSTHPMDSWFADWDLIADSSDDAVLVFTDIRNGPDWDVYAYRIDVSQNQLWGPNGVTISSDAEFDASPQVVEASDGDFVIVWNYQPSAADGKIRMQRLSPAGAPRLAAGGIDVAGDPGETPGFCKIVAAENGEVIVAWIRDMATFMSPRHVRAAKFNAAGVPVWAGPVAVFDSVSVPIAHQPRLVADGRGGAVLGWHRWDLGWFNAFVQHLDANGAELFIHNGVAVSISANRNILDPDIAFVPATGAIMAFWNERDSGQNQWGISAQKILPSGALAFGGTGIAIRPVNGVHKDFPHCAAYADGAVAVWKESVSGTGTPEKLVAVRLDGAGNQVWAGATLDVSTASSGKSRYPVHMGAGGMLKVVWEDNRNGNPDLFLQNVNPGGSLGAPSLRAGTWRLSLATGGSASFALEAGSARAGHVYLVAGSLTGIAPGIPIGGSVLPLVPDFYLELTLNAPGLPLFGFFAGALDSIGHASASLQLPSGLGPQFVGLTLHHAFVAIDPVVPGVFFCSGAVSVTLEP